MGKKNGDAAGRRAAVQKIAGYYDRFGMIIILCLLVVLMSIIAPNFLTKGNIINVFKQISFIAIVAMGVMCIIITTGIDLSSGSVIAMSSVVGASFAVEGQSVAMAFILALLVGVAVGAFNGTIIAYAKIPPFIVTLGTMTIVRGIALLYSGGKPISGLNQTFTWLGAGSVFGIPVPVILLIVVTVVTHFMLNNTKFGRHVYALGGNEHAAVISGINVRKIKILVYTYASFLAALAGIALTGRVQSGQPGLGTGYELDAIAAAVIGGTSQAVGGVGRATGTIVGALIIGVINNGMDMMSVSAYWQQIVKGAIIILAVILDQFSKKNAK